MGTILLKYINAFSTQAFVCPDLPLTLPEALNYSRIFRVATL